MRRRALTVFLLLVCYGAASYDWPVDEPRIGSSFAQETWSALGTGITVLVPAATQERGAAVHPIASGEVVFAYDPSTDYSSFPRGLGGFVVVEHPERVRSAYAHLDPGSIISDRGARVNSESILGRLGDSGAARGVGAYLSILDLETAVILNPLIVLPAAEDPQPPVIAGIYLSDSGGDAVLDGMRAAPGTYEILVETYDLRDDVPFAWRLAPYGISVSINGRQVSSMVFDGIRSADDRLVIAATGSEYDDVYSADWVYRTAKVDLLEGETRLQVFVRDFAGNESQLDRTISIAGERP